MAEPEQQEGEPQLKFTIRNNEGVYMWNGPDDICEDDSVNFGEGIKKETYSEDGKYLALICQDKVEIYDISEKAIKCTIEHSGVTSVYFSPLNTYLLTWQRFANRTNDNNQSSNEGNNNDNNNNNEENNVNKWSSNPEKNLLVWDISTCEAIGGFTQKNFDKSSWPTIKWTNDEVMTCRVSSMGIDFHSGVKFGIKTKQLKLKGAGNVEWAPVVNNKYMVVCFVPEKGSKPANIRLVEYPQVTNNICFQTVFRAKNANIKWNSLGTNVLIQTQTDVDRTGKSYYGETNLFIMSTDGSKGAVPFDEGTIYDCSWRKQGDKFIVVHGKMPSKTTLFDKKCKKLIDFPVRHRNTAMFSPNGFVLAIGGFGNLKGDVDFWDVKRGKRVSSISAPCSAHYQWSPCSRFFLTAVLSPRLRVDNGFKIWNITTSQILFEKEYPQLFQTEWLPLDSSLFNTKPPTQYANSNNNSGNNTSNSPQSKPPAKQKYIPPSLRGKRKAETVDAPDVVQKYTVKKSNRSNVPIGGQLAKPMSKSARRRANKKKRQQQQQQQQQNDNDNNSDNNNNGDNNKTDNNNSNDSNNNQQNDDQSPQSLKKRIRAINKKLRRIEQLKLKQDKGEGLFPEQITKINTEKTLLAELKALEDQQKQLQQQ